MPITTTEGYNKVSFVVARLGIIHFWILFCDDINLQMIVMILTCMLCFDCKGFLHTMLTCRRLGMSSSCGSHNQTLHELYIGEVQRVYMYNYGKRASRYSGKFHQL